MKLLITPAIKLNKEQKTLLMKDNELFFIEDERIPISQTNYNFRLDEIEGIVCNFFFQNNSIDVLSRLRFVQTISVGLERLPLKDFLRRGIKYYNVGDAYAIPMAEWALDKTLEIYKHSKSFYEKQKNREWIKDRTIDELYNKKALIIGYGNVGRGIAKRLMGFDVHISIIDIEKITSDYIEYSYTLKELEHALSDNDLIYLTLPITEQTYHIINKNTLKTMNEDSVLINVSRGALIDEAALIEALEIGKFRGVALDVFEEEPLKETNPLWSLDRVIATPHNSFIGTGNDERVFQRLLNNLQLYRIELSGR